MTAASPLARVGPNAVTQLSAVLEDRRGPTFADAVFEAGGLLELRAHPPHEMIDQRIAIAAHQAMWRLVDHDEAEALAFEAGVRTANYLLANRIPRPAQWVLKGLPRRLAADVLLKAISRNAWTFAGSGRFQSKREGAIVHLAIEENPLATGPCAWHRGVFTRLFTELVSPDASVRETECVAEGAAACRFEVALR
ncbi:MAG: bacteriochlorophyll 4-vinyl reductase [Myxococcales bacterium]|nr:bacteriochlorophyll 4-vinyl reductase [Myxococcales bacterium]